jgi:uncharacterized protein (TIGR00251 family)
MIDLEPHPEGILLPVRAQPGSRNSGLRGEQQGELKVSVTQVAEKGKANQAIIEVLAKGLGLRRSQIELHSGESSRHKKLLVSGVSIAELRERIRAALPPVDARDAP